MTTLAKLTAAWVSAWEFLTVPVAGGEPAAGAAREETTADADDRSQCLLMTYWF